MKAYLLAVDIGNTNIALGVYDAHRPLAQWRIATEAQRLTDEYAVLLDGLLHQQDIAFSDIGGCVFASVVPPLTGIFASLARRYLNVEPVIVGEDIETGVRILYDNPHEVGADRIVNALAVQRKYGTPAIVVDFGTATTFDVISAEGDYMGGIIAPGMGISAEALFQRAAKLPEVELTAPPTAIGKNTINSMQAGLVLGYVAMVEGLIQRIEDELGAAAHVVATGGLGDLIAAHTASIQHVDTNLTIEGLRMIYEMNRPDAVRH